MTSDEIKIFAEHDHSQCHAEAAQLLYDWTESDAATLMRKLRLNQDRGTPLELTPRETNFLRVFSFKGFVLAAEDAAWNE